MSEKRTQWCGNGSKVAHLGAKTAVFGHKRLQTPQMAGKSGSNGGSQWDTCGGSTLSAKLVRKMHPVVRKWPQICPFGAKNDFFLPQIGAISTTTGCIFLKNFASRVDTTNMFYFDPPFVPLLPFLWGLLGHLGQKKKRFGPRIGHFCAISIPFCAFF